ncbi:MAG: serine hydrolase domain-containing protein [Planctomycetota bacterium]
MNLLALLASTCTLAALAHPFGTPSRETEKARIEAYLESCEAYGWSGVAYVERDGKVLLHRGYGLADRKAKRKNGPETLFEIASATKPITACAVMALVEEGKIKLEDSIAKHLPGVPEDKASITIEHLLAHTSGMPRMGDAGHGHDLKAAVAAYLAPAPVRAPGEAYEYWNGGYALLAAVIANVSEESYQDFCQRRLFDRADMNATGFTGDDSLPEKRQATGYRGDAEVRQAADHPYGSYGYQYLGMGGVVSNAKDLARFADAFDSGTLLKPETAARMVEPRTPGSGLGWRVTETARGTRRIGHGGDVAGFHTQWQRFPDERAQIIVFSNGDSGPPLQLAWNIESMLFGAKPAYPVPPSQKKIARRDLDAAAGTYESKDGTRLTVAREGSALVVSAGAAIVGDGSKAPELSPKEREIVDLARAFLDDVTAGRAEALGPRIVERVPPAWAYTLTGLIWPKHAARWGALKEARCVSVTSGGSYWTLQFRLEHEQGPRPLQMVFHEKKLSGFDLEAKGDKVAGTYVWTEDDRFSRFDWGPRVGWMNFHEGIRGRQTLRTSDGMGRFETFRRVDD